MAKRFTWCFKRTLLLTFRSMVHKQSPLLVPNDHAIYSRSLTNLRTNGINVDYDEPKAFRDFVDDSKCGYNTTVETLTKILSVARAQAKKAIEDYPNLKLLPKRTIYNNFQALREGGFYKSTIKDNKYLLTDDTATLQRKIRIMKNIDIDINDAAALFNLPAVQLEHFQRQCKFDASYLPACNRIVYLAEKLQCDAAKICEVMAYNTWMLKRPAPKLLTMTEYILGIGMAPEHILGDVLIYNYTLATIKKKAERAKRAGVHPIKPWVLRCQDSIWKKVEDRQANRNSTLAPGQTIAEHLRDIFECDLESVEFLLAKNRQLRVMDLKKLTKMAKLFREEGYKIEDIQRVPCVMNRRYDTLLDRFAKWKKVSRQRPPLGVLSLGKKKYDEAIKIESSKHRDEKLS